MKNQELFDYIKQQTEEGVSREYITSTLLDSGWSNEEIEESFSFVIIPTPVAPKTNVVPLQSTVNLAGIGALTGQAWSIYKNRFWTLLFISSTPFLFLLLYGVTLSIFSLLKIPIVVATLTIILFSVVIYIFGIWSMLATLYTIKDNTEKIGVIKSYSRAWSKLFSFWWLMLLFSFLIFGGSILFIIPAILFIIWFLFAPYILIEEDLKGLSALMKSKEYVKGVWWAVFGRMLVVFVPILIVYAIVGFIIVSLGIGESLVSNLIIIIIDVLIFPFVFAYSFSLYKSLKETRGEFIFDLKKGRKKFIAIIILGGIIIPLGILSSVIFMRLNSAREKAQDIVGKIEVGLLNTEITKYFNKNGVLPKSLKEVIPPGQKESNLIDSLTGKVYEYNVGQNNTYSICTVQNGDKKYCIGDMKSEDIPKDISLLPKYGGVEKTVEQKSADKKFIDGAIKKFGSRKEAYSQTILRGKVAFKKRDLDVAMRRFNEAWLIDSQSPEVYLMMSIVETTRDNPDSAISLLQEGLSFDETNAWLRCNLALPYVLKSKLAQNETAKTMYESKAKQAMDKALKHEPDNINCKKLQKILKLN